MSIYGACPGHDDKLSFFPLPDAIAVERDVSVPMPDGARIALNVLPSGSAGLPGRRFSSTSAPLRV